MTSPPSPLVCIIVHYGDPTLTTNCIASLLAGSHAPYIIVVSNTDDASFEALKVACPVDSGVHFEPMHSNKGFASACNAGLRIARHIPHLRHAWLLNNDATAAPDAAERLLSCLERHPRALCGTSVFRADAPEKLELALGCRFSPLTTIIAPCHAGALPQSVPHAPQVDYIYGASFAFSLSLVEAIGFLDERFFLYYEEHDFCARARKAGYTFYWCRDAHVWHGFVAPSESPLPRTGSAATTAMRAFKHFHETRSTMLFMRKHYALLLLPAMLFRTLGKVFVLWRRGELHMLKSYFRGLLEGLRRSSL